MKNILSILTILYLVCAFEPWGFCGSGLNVGGYDVAAIAASTAGALQKKKELADVPAAELTAPAGTEPSDALASGSAIVDFYDRLGNLLIKRGLVTAGEIENAKQAAVKSGGLKIAGYNPVILAASFLNLLVEKGMISLPEAQSILDSSKKTK